MNIIFISYMDFTGPGVIHMFHFANGLIKAGNKVLFLLNGEPDTVNLMEEAPLFKIIKLNFKGVNLDTKIVHAITHFKPHIIHLWTPRNIVARAGLELKYLFQARLFIHYEDDEDILATENGIKFFNYLPFAVDSFLFPEKWVWVHPFTYSLVNRYADGLTVISQDYGELLSNRWKLPVSLLIPGVDLARFSPAIKPDRELVEKFNLADKKVLLYGGSIAKFYDFEIILDAFKQISDKFPNTVIVQYGRNFMEKEIKIFLKKHNLEKRVFLMGKIPHHEVTRYLSLGDIFLQPGRNSSFNSHRLPSKLPEYLAMGKPVITFSCGIGKELTHKKNAYKLEDGNSDELAEAITNLLSNKDLCLVLSKGARKRAEELFSWHRSVEKLSQFYRKLIFDPYYHNRQQLIIKATKATFNEDDVFNNKDSLEKGENSHEKQNFSENSSVLWNELFALREFHRKVTSTILYKVYFRIKLLIAWLKKSEKK